MIFKKRTRIPIMQLESVLHFEEEEDEEEIPITWPR